MITVLGIAPSVGPTYGVLVHLDPELAIERVPGARAPRIADSSLDVAAALAGVAVAMASGIAWPEPQFTRLLPAPGPSLAELLGEARS